MAKKEIHPKYFDIKIICTTCNTEYISGSTKEKELKIDTCSSCHSFYTNNKQFINIAGRIEQFKSKFNKKEELIKKIKKISKIQKEINKKYNKNKNI